MGRFRAQRTRLQGKARRASTSCRRRRPGRSPYNRSWRARRQSRAKGGQAPWLQRAHGKDGGRNVRSALTARGYRGGGCCAKTPFLPNKPNFPEYWTVWNRLMDKVLVAKVRQFVTWLCFAELASFCGVRAVRVRFRPRFMGSFGFVFEDRTDAGAGPLVYRGNGGKL